MPDEILEEIEFEENNLRKRDIFIGLMFSIASIILVINYLSSRDLMKDFKEVRDSVVSARLDCSFNYLLFGPPLGRLSEYATSTQPPDTNLEKTLDCILEYTDKNGDISPNILSVPRISSHSNIYENLALDFDIDGQGARITIENTPEGGHIQVRNIEPIQAMFPILIPTSNFSAPIISLESLQEHINSITISRITFSSSEEDAVCSQPTEESTFVSTTWGRDGQVISHFSTSDLCTILALNK